MLLPNKGKLLALDLGKRFTGVAVSDRTQQVVFPRDEIETKNQNILIETLKGLIKSESIAGLIVGLPLNTQNEETKQSTWVREIIEALDLEIPVHFADEAYTSANIEASGRKDSLVAQKLMEKVLSL